MRSKGRGIKLGLFVTIGLLLFIGIIYYMGTRKNLFGDTIIVYCLFENVTGLQEGNNIRFGGINVGTVGYIEIVSDTSVKVEMTIKQSAAKFIKTDGIAVIGSEGLMGNKVINISSGTKGRLIQEYDIIPSHASTEIDDILANLKMTSENAVYITEDLHELVEKINNGQGPIGKFLFDSTLSKEFEQTVRNIKRGTAGFDENMEALKHNFLFRKYYKEKEKEKLKKEKEEAGETDNGKKWKGIFSRKKKNNEDDNGEKN